MAGARAEITHAEMTLATNATQSFSEQAKSLFQQLDSFLVTTSTRYQGLQADMFQRARLKLADTGNDIAQLTNVMQTRMAGVNRAYAMNDEEAAGSMSSQALHGHEVKSILA